MREANVVGVDGSDSAINAVRWAANDAALHHVPLRLVSVGPESSPDAARAADDSQRNSWLTAAAELATETAPQCEALPVLLRGIPHAVLVEESQQARRIIVGSRGLGERTGLPVGSTAEAIAMHARCPVAVVRKAVPEHARTSPVLVGVDGSRASEAAVAVAFEEASVRRVPLVAVHVWVDVAADPWFATFDKPWAEIAETERALLAERLAGRQEKYPDVEVHRVVERDRPVRYLVEHAENAQLIVVGSRGRGGVPGMLLGSTSRALLHMAPRPVLIVRSPGL